MTETSTSTRELRPRGLLNHRAAAEKLSLSLYPPSDDLAPFVQQYWAVRWDLRGQEPHLQENIPHPCVSVVMERGGPWSAYGVVTRKFGYRLVDEGRVLGIKFRPGGFHPFLKSPLSRLTDRAVPLATIPGAEAADTLAREVDALDDEPCRIARVEAFLRAMQPRMDSTLELIGRVVDRIVDHREITRLDEAVAGMGVTPRTLQRMFNRYVGVSPAWVIRRYRLIEAADEVAAGGEVNFSRLAIRLGYFDQAHFINHFRDLVGQAPAEYARAQA